MARHKFSLWLNGAIIFPRSKHTFKVDNVEFYKTFGKKSTQTSSKNLILVEIIGKINGG